MLSEVYISETCYKYGYIIEKDWQLLSNFFVFLFVKINAFIHSWLTLIPPGIFR